MRFLDTLFGVLVTRIGERVQARHPHPSPERAAQAAVAYLYRERVS